MTTIEAEDVPVPAKLFRLSTKSDLRHDYKRATYCLGAVRADREFSIARDLISSEWRKKQFTKPYSFVSLWSAPKCYSDNVKIILCGRK